MPRGYPYYQVPNLLQGLGSTDPACHAKYDLAWGNDLDRMGKGSTAYNKAGELPPATPDPH